MKTFKQTRCYSNPVNNIKGSVCLLFGATLLATSSVQAAEDWIKPGEDKIKISLGVFFPSFDTSLRVDNTEIDLGSDINLEDDLGLNSNETTFWVGLDWRIASRHRLSLGNFTFSRDASATALKDLEIDNEIIQAGASVSTAFDMSITPIAYSYSFIKKEKHEFAGNLGLHWNDIDLAVAASASASVPGSTETADGQVSADAIAPMPLIGVRYDYFPAPRWQVGVLAQFFDISISQDTFSFDGSLTNFRVSGEYWIINHFGLGVAVNYFNIDVDVQDDDWRGSMEYEYFGPQLYVTGRF